MGLANDYSDNNNVLKANDKFSSIEQTQVIVNYVVNTVNDIVCSTMGPDGNVVVIQQGTAVKTTKDGATVARSLEFQDFHMDKINQIMAESARKTELECGDGTTTTIFLTKLYYDLFTKHKGFVNRKYIEDLTNKVIEVLKRNTVKVEIDSKGLQQVANITANQDESIVKTVLGIYRNYKSPNIELEEGNKLEDVVSKQNGMSMRMQIASPMFTEGKTGGMTILKKGTIFLVINETYTEGKTIPQDIGKALGKLNEKYPGSDFALVVNQASSSFCSCVEACNRNIAACSGAPGRPARFSVFSTNVGGSLGGLIMGDIATILNSGLYPNLQETVGADLHPSDVEVIANMEKSFIPELTEETFERIEKRVELIQDQLDNMDNGSRYSPLGNMTEKRINELLGQTVTIYVGGQTASDIKERKDRFEDVALAVKSALENGILPGCGIALRDAGWEVFNAEFENLNNESSYKSAILMDITNLFFQQFRHLMKPDEGTCSELFKIKQVTNLATGEVGTPEELGIYDTAYASITALKGGMKTANILANTSSIILGNRAGAVTF